MEIAIRFLGARPRARREIARRLVRAGVTEAIAEETLTRLADLGYVDDAAFARWWAEQRDRHAPRGRRMLEAELRMHGVPRDAIEELGEILAAPDRVPEDEGLPASEEERAEVALRRHLRGRPLPADPVAIRRVGMFLMRRGFGSETVRATIRAAQASGGADESSGLLE
ncbi:MAG: regulatory protein RecX [Candidatus Limnocylindria bacterium]